MQMERVAIFGLGNVALDCARVLLRGEDAMGRTDIARHAQEALKQSAVKRVDIIGRRGPVQARTFMCSLRFNTPLPLLASIEHVQQCSLQVPRISTAGILRGAPSHPRLCSSVVGGVRTEAFDSVAGGVHHEGAAGDHQAPLRPGACIPGGDAAHGG